MWLADVRHALRLLRARPTFTATAILTLALGLGANSAMFSVVRAVLLEPLPYPQPEQLIRIVGFERGTSERVNLSPADFLDFARETKTLARMGAHGFIGYFTVGDAGGDAERLGGVNVTEGFFPTLGARMAVGRSFSAEEDSPGGPRAVVLGHRLWRRRYAADPGIVGRSIQVNGQPATVVGVLDDRFRHIEINPEREADLFVPYQFETAAPNRGGHFIRAIGRLAPGASVSGARAELVTIAERLERDYPRDNTNRIVHIQPLADAIVETARPALIILSVAVAFVLLVACTNLANLLIANATTRRGEIAVRVALGAGQWQIARQLLIESLTLACGGALAGLALAAATMPLLTGLQSAGLPGAADIRIDGVVLAFAVAAMLLTGLVVGLLPAWHLSRGDVHVAVRESGRGPTRGVLRRSLRELLVASQIALTLVLLAGAGLMVRSLSQLQHVDTGFDADRVLTFDTAVPTATYEEGEQITFYDRFYEHIRALPGVVTVGATNILPLSAGYDSRGIQIEAAPVEPSLQPSAQARSVSADFFRAMGIPLLEGRTFDDRDAANAPLVVIVSAAMAQRYWPGQSALGQRITFNAGIPRAEQRDVGGPGSREVVGVVGDVKHLALDERDAVPVFYTPQAQQPSYHTMTLVVRAATDPAALTAAIRHELQALDKSVPLYRVRTLDAVVRTVTAQPRMQTWLLGCFAAMALFLAAVGVYGVIGSLVGQRTQEIAVRLALGAARAHVLGAVMVEGLRPVVIGLAIGATAATAATRFMRGMLYAVSTTDVPTYLAAAMVLSLTACAAIWIPARRAARVDPMAALRE